MPDLIGHFGAQGFATRAIVRKAPIPWILLGATLPDVPWIVQRLVHEMQFVDPYRLRMYFVAQASLFGCALVAGALASFSGRPRAVFGVLFLNSGLHLLLDACQTKWANGVHFFAPFSWQAVNFEFFWPESLPNYALQALGVGFLIAMWRSKPDSTWAPCRPPARRLAIGFGCLAAYFVLPLACLQSPGLADNAFVGTLRDYETRPGKRVEFDRNVIETIGGDRFITAINDEKIRLAGEGIPDSGLVSVRGRFLDRFTVQVESLHVHSRGLRDFASYVGLALLLIYWARWMLLLRFPDK